MPQLGGIQSLEIDCNGLTDEGVRHLSGIAGLNDLTLIRCGITDAAIVDLARIPTLRRVEFRATKVTEEGMDRLRVALPECKVRSERSTYREP